LCKCTAQNQKATTVRSKAYFREKKRESCRGKERPKLKKKRSEVLLQKGETKGEFRLYMESKGKKGLCHSLEGLSIVFRTEGDREQS